MAPSARTKIFVGHLPDGCTNADLKALFDKYGSVTECDVINKYGFVHMSSTEEADAAIKSLNNFNFMGSCISVEPSTSKLHPEPGAPGRAPGGPMRRGGGPPRNGFSRGGDSYYNDNYYDDYRRDYPPMMPPRDPYYSRDRARPYPLPYERRAPPLRDDPYQRRPMDDPYARRAPPASIGGGGSTHDDPYERRGRAPPDYMYSRRSPPQASSSSWYSSTGSGSGW